VSFKIYYRPEAELDIEDAAKWYEQQRLNLGVEFVEEIERKGSLIEDNPMQYEEVHKSLHRAVVDRFPFNIFYLIENKSIIIVAVMHGSRHPKRWKKRT
jgi:plasmid stabilization system protein ParE